MGEKAFLLDGKPLQIRCGEIHFARVPREYWSHRLRMIKAMGLNTVCAYLFWNFHEWNEGTYDWSGQRDAAEFCRLAQEEGLWVILRPGPYACAEWEMGGLPWWLLKNEGNAFLRTRDPAFMGPARRWLTEVGRELGPLQVSRGGPILMVQVENEYGFFGKDADYVRDVQKAVLEAGFDVPLFQCNPTGAVVSAHLPGLFSVANFGSNPQAGFEALAKVQKGPLMCGEFYPGWFDTWGTPHKRGDNARTLADMDWMLAQGGSFSLYMAHGGTTFGLWAGADRPFRPDTSTYDYDAPISEAGLAAPKYPLFRDTLARYLAPGETLPAPAPAPRIIAVPSFSLEESAPVLANLRDLGVREKSPGPIERLGISRGLISYATTLPAGAATMLEADRVHDLAFVFLDGKQVGVMDRRTRRFRVALPERAQDSRLEILVYTIARVNFGIEVHDRKGLHGPVRITGASTSLSVDASTGLSTGASTSLSTGASTSLSTGWEIRAIDFGADGALPELRWGKAKMSGPSFRRGSFTVAETGDTYLDLSNWGTGIVWVNGKCLGRYWNIGPAQTLYLPGPWMRVGKNEVVVLDLSGPQQATIAGLTEPVLDRLRPELDFFPRNNRSTLVLDGLSAVHEGSFEPGSAPQEIRFKKTVQARQFWLEALDAHDGKGFAAVAEIALLDEQGRVLDQGAWTIAHANSEEAEKEDGSALNAINGQASDHWHTQWGGRPPHPGFPHRLVIDLGATVNVTGFRYTPRQGPAEATGRIRHFRIFTGQALAKP